MMNSIHEANRAAVKNMQEARPLWTDVKYAYEVFEKMDKYTLLHTGPPISFDNMCEPMKGAIVAALLYEGLASKEEEALAIVTSGKVKFYPCNDFNAVVPMTGIISYSMPLIKVENLILGNCAYSTINEGSGAVARLGFCEDSTVNGLIWIREVLAPALKKYLSLYGKIDLKNIIEQALYMGDKLPMRNNAGTNMLLSIMAYGLIDVIEDEDQRKEVIGFISQNNQFFLNFAMAAAKCIADSAHNIPFSTVITSLSRNGVEAGIKISGLGDQWFTTAADKVKGLYFSNYKEEDSNLDIGDSAILETVGLGAFTLGGSQDIIKYSDDNALDIIKEMQKITLEESHSFIIPNMSLSRMSIGIDMIKVIERGITPIIATAIIGKHIGHGIIGIGLSKMPLEAFEKALEAYERSYTLG